MIEMLTACPEVTSEIFSALAEDDYDGNYWCPDLETEVIAGVIIAVGMDGLPFIRVLAEGVSYDLVLHSYFEGAGSLVGGANISGKKVSLLVVTQKVYNPEKSSFEERREIVGLAE